MPEFSPLLIRLMKEEPVMVKVCPVSCVFFRSLVTCHALSQLVTMYVLMELTNNSNPIVIPWALDLLKLAPKAGLRYFLTTLVLLLCFCVS